MQRAEAARRARFEQRDQHLLGCARVGRAFKYDQLPGAQLRSQGARGLLDVAQVRLMVLRKRRRHADNDRVHLAHGMEVAGGAKARAMRRCNLCPGDAHDVRTGGVERCDLLGVDVKAGHGKALFGKQQRQRQPHVAHPDDADPGLARRDPCERPGVQSGGGTRSFRSRSVGVGHTAPPHIIRG